MFGSMTFYICNSIEENKIKTKDNKNRNKTIPRAVYVFIILDMYAHTLNTQIITTIVIHPQS